MRCEECKQMEEEECFNSMIQLNIKKMQTTNQKVYLHEELMSRLQSLGCPETEHRPGPCLLDMAQLIQTSKLLSG